MIFVMKKSSLQIRIPESLVAEIERLSEGSKSAFVRAAIEDKILQETHRRLEARWIEALRKKPRRRSEDAAWLKAEA